MSWDTLFKTMWEWFFAFADGLSNIWNWLITPLPFMSDLFGSNITPLYAIVGVGFVAGIVWSITKIL